MSSQLDSVFESYYEDFNEELFLLSIAEYLKPGGDVNALSKKYDTTFMHCAADNGLVSIIKWLVENGADLEVLNNQSWTPLLLAVDAEIDDSVQNNVELNFQITSLLYRLGASVNATNPEGSTIFDIAESYGSYAIKKLNAAVT